METNDVIKAKVWRDRLGAITLELPTIDLSIEDEVLIATVELQKCTEEFNSFKGEADTIELGDRVWVNGLEGFHEVISIVREK